MNPIVIQELKCDVCFAVLATPLTKVHGLRMPLVMTTCPNQECENNGKVLVMEVPQVEHSEGGMKIRAGFVIKGTMADLSQMKREEYKKRYNPYDACSPRNFGVKEGLL